MADGNDTTREPAQPDWSKVAEIVAEALELDPSARVRFVLDRCRMNEGVVDHDLAREVVDLIEASEAADKSDALRPPVSGLAAAVATEESLREVSMPERIGSWKPTNRLGAGGMGVVYEAIRDDDTFEQRAAVKLVHPAFGLDFERHFLRERAVLAGLQHPGIARLLDGGRMLDGTPWLAMELVEGDTLIEYAKRKSLSIADRVALFLQACEAVAYAHQNLVVHRDLKPAHVLIDEGSKKPQVKLLDFGIAKLVTGDSDMTVTSTGRGPLTMAYAAPEQLLGQSVTTATDVYSLGLVLYELITGQRAYDISNLTASQTERIVVEHNPPAPSSMIEDRSIARLVEGDLDTVVLKAMAKDPARRYSTAAALGDDLLRFLTNRPVAARPDSAGYRIRKFVARNRRAVTASIVVLTFIAVLAAAFTAGLTRERNRARIAAEEATANAERAEAISGFLEKILRAPNTRWYVEGEAKGPDTPIAAVLAEAAAQLEIDFVDRPDIRADLHHILGDTYMSLGLVEETRTHHLTTLELRRQLYEPPHPKLAEALYYAYFVQEDLPSGIRLLRRAVDMQMEFTEGNNFPFMVQSLVPWELDVANYERADELASAAYTFADTWFAQSETTSSYRLPLMAYLAATRAEALAALGDQNRATQWIARGDSVVREMPADSFGYPVWVFLRQAEAVVKLGRGEREDGLGMMRALLADRYDDLGSPPVSSPTEVALSVYARQRLADSLFSDAERRGDPSIASDYADLARTNRTRVAMLRAALGDE